MPVYARSDVMSVVVSRSHGGCGQPHSRPVRGGAPAKTWALDCPQCQRYLTHDPAWSGTLADVPSTPDEDMARDNVEKSTVRSREDIMALALAKIAGLPVAEFLEPMIRNTANQGIVTCDDGHENVPGGKFCAECGARISTGAGRELTVARSALQSNSVTTGSTAVADVQWVTAPDVRGDMTADGSPAPQARPDDPADTDAVAKPVAARPASRPRQPGKTRATVRPAQPRG